MNLIVLNLKKHKVSKKVNGGFRNRYMIDRVIVVFI